MSDLIDKLAEQATDNILGVPVLDKRKFAKLIVKECADLVDHAISDGGVDGRVVKEHFGVEE